MRKSLFAASILVVSVAVAPACASKNFVRGQVGEINQKVDTLSESLEETQERTRKNEERIGQVDQKAEAAGKSAADARSAAEAAAASAQQVGTRVDAVETAARRLVYEVTLSEDQGNFRFGQTAMPEEAKARIDEVINQLKSDPKGIYIEIEGHTDNVGPSEVNDRIGLERAEAVKRYIYEAHQIPLHKINVISYGEEKPIAPNRTSEGRAQNRRVVIRVLS